ncbi:hypothetical protein [Deinococcus petrolearius]|uniref:Flagellar protein FliT n=1 Tax=Deinococcus petrolearius TaxID=1751295 RepID=A0ABW1DLS0_9DEIO
MTLGQQEQQLQDVLVVIEAARIPQTQARMMSETLRALVDRRADLARLLVEMRRDLEEVLVLLDTLEPEGDEQRAACARMVEHLRRDLVQVQAGQQAVEHAAGTMYAGFYTLL